MSLQAQPELYFSIDDKEVTIGTTPAASLLITRCSALACQPFYAGPLSK
jgi:hypothetical protein